MTTPSSAPIPAALKAAIAMEDGNRVLCAYGEDFAKGIVAFRESGCRIVTPE